ncbi:MAG TPA: arylamine N-acetyltransferase [Candidatus Limnocylindrales bacterium]
MIIDIDAYLRRLGLSRPGSASAAVLGAIHRAHVSRVPYENLLIQLDRPADLDAATTVSRILRGGGGYCFELNGALAALLEALGFQVSRYEGRVWHHRPDSDSPVNHMPMIVRCDDGSRWLVEAGMSDAVAAPLPLTPGEVRQGPFTYRLERVGDDGWRFHHDPDGCFDGMDFRLTPPVDGVFQRAHARLSRSPESPFMRALVVARRDTTGADVLRGRVLWRWDEAGRRSRTLGGEDEFFAVLGEFFGLPVDDLDAAARGALWRKVCDAHEAWVHKRGAPMHWSAPAPIGSPGTGTPSTATPAPE